MIAAIAALSRLTDKKDYPGKKTVGETGTVFLFHEHLWVVGHWSQPNQNKNVLAKTQSKVAKAAKRDSLGTTRLQGTLDCFGFASRSSAVEDFTGNTSLPHCFFETAYSLNRPDGDANSATRYSICKDGVASEPFTALSTWAIRFMP